jgi:hypothetical protein
MRPGAFGRIQAELATEDDPGFDTCAVAQAAMPNLGIAYEFWIEDGRDYCA